MFVLLDRAFARSRGGTSPRRLSEALRVPHGSSRVTCSALCRPVLVLVRLEE
jgi:hypothetical protein